MNSAGKVLLYILLFTLAAFLVSIVFMYTREDPEAVRKKNSNIRVEVLNGCGENRLAMKVANVLRKQGFNVVKIGNAGQSDFENTVVIERSTEDYTNAKYFAKRIGCKYIGRDIDPALHLEVTLILGRDYLKYFADVEQEF
ncbi:MAG: LytR C-terminal domain-containing protein [candidate division WOR-3 bacterium]|nr:MAG: LytR C-terminal domain-containing protein [candidate division WOR-3 bacterium]